MRKWKMPQWKEWLKQLDDLLRGEATLMTSLEEGRIDIRVGGLAFVTIALGAIYGACMGSYGVLAPNGSGGWQILASAVKLPLLFFLTLLVTFPSLYVFNALVGSRLSMESVLRLLVAMLGVMLAVLSSLGPIVVFFSLSTTSYSFMKLINVVTCGMAGFLGLAFLLRTLHRLVLVQEQLATSRRRDEQADHDHEAAAGEDEGHGVAGNESDVPPESEQQPPGEAARSGETLEAMRQVKPPPSPGPPKDAQESNERTKWHGALDLIGAQTSERARTVFNIWVLVFALVGAQMSWVLRPFIGSPDMPFSWFRPRAGNFFQAVLHAFWHLFT